MTTKPETMVLPPAPSKTQLLDEDLSSNFDYYIFEQLFSLGYAESEPITIYKDERSEFIIKYRTLTPTEMRDVVEASSAFDTIEAKVITEKIETLARAITTINHSPLVLTQKERQEYFEKHEKQPSPLTMARIIIYDKIKSMEMIELLYEKYMEFSSKVTEDFEKGKKKLEKD